MDDITRRRFLAGVGGLVGLQLAGPVVLRLGGAVGAAAVDPAAANRRRIVVISLFGGNDGLNTVVPMADVRRAAYEKARPVLKYGTDAVLPLNVGADADHALGFNPKLTTLHRLYGERRVAVVQGVDYPDHSYSHFTSSDIWQSGQPDRAPSSGWLGRHLDRAGIADGELRAIAFGTDLPLILRGENIAGTSITGISETRFADGTDPYADLRHAALASYASHPDTEPLRRSAGAVAQSAVRMVDQFETVSTPPAAPTHLSRMLVSARTLLEHPLGTEVVFIEHAGFDTHTGQRRAHEALLDDLDASLEAFFFGTYRGSNLGLGVMSDEDQAKTLVLVYSEFGRRVGENGAGEIAGTDHGAAGPMFVVGPAAGAGVRLVGGLHGEHPDVGTALLPADNLKMTTDMRSVYAAVLNEWLADPDPLFDRVAAVPGLFAT